MLEIKYFSKTGFSTLRTFKGPGGMTMKWGLKDKISLALLPQLSCTSYKFSVPNSIYSALIDPEVKEREIKLMKGLSLQCPVVPIIRAKRFDNACYINGLPDLIKEQGWTEDDLKQLCYQWGMEYQEFRSKLKDHIVILGDRFACAVVLAHEFGHYLNTIGKGEPEGQKAHAKYSSAANTFQWLNLLSGISLTAGTGVSVALTGDNRNTSILTTLLISIAGNIGSMIAAKPILTSEKCASLTAMKNLKKLEVDESYAVRSRKFLDEALDTYLTHYKKMPIILTTVKTGVTAMVVANRMDVIK